MRTIVKLLAGCFVSVFAASIQATPITFTGTSGTLSASVTFDVSGTDLLVSLINTSTTAPNDPGDILSGVIFSITGNPLLTRVSAVICPTCAVINNGGLTGAGGDVGGEWAYSNALVGAFVGQQSLYSSGYFSGTGFQFNANNLQGPVSVDGIQYGITTSNYTAGSGNGGISGEGLVQNEVDFVLSGFSGSLASISDVSFQYGTALTEANIPGIPVRQVPEPASLLLVGLGLATLGLARRRR